MAAITGGLKTGRQRARCWVFIDDATSRLMTLHFTATESTFSYFEATRRYIEQHGKPMALYHVNNFSSLLSYWLARHICD